MPSFIIYDNEEDEELLPEQDSEEIIGFGYDSPETALEAYREEFGSLERFYSEDEHEILELVRGTGWTSFESLPSRKDMIRRAETEALQQLEEKIDEN